MGRPWGRAVLYAGLAMAGPAAARTLEVGATAPLRTLADAVAKAEAGDTIRLAAGEYYECATLTVPDLVLQGAGPGTILTDSTCAGKAILVARGDRLSVRDLVLARARVVDENGAGIRLEARGLVVERVRFDNDQVGIMTGVDGPGEVRVTESSFSGGGIAGDRPSFALQIGAIDRLLVERCRFTGVKGGQVNSRARQTDLFDNRIETGVEAGAGPAVLVSAGALSMRGNVLAVGPQSPSRDVAVLADAQSARLEGNTLQNTTGRPQRLLLDWTATRPVLSGNTIRPGDTEVTSDGLWRHRTGTLVRGWVADARAMAGAARRAVLGWIRP